jgi:hypothetical protein
MTDEQKQTQSHEPEFKIEIDRKHYDVSQDEMTGAQLRKLPVPPIGPDRDLFEVVPGKEDRKIGDDEVVKIRSGLRFFTAPAHINPGSSLR